MQHRRFDGPLKAGIWFGADGGGGGCSSAPKMGGGARIFLGEESEIFRVSNLRALWGQFVLKVLSVMLVLMPALLLCQMPYEPCNLKPCHPIRLYLHDTTIKWNTKF